MLPHPYICPLGPKSVDVVGIGGGSLLVLMIKTPYPFHTHSRSSLYIYEVFHDLTLLIVAKGHRKQPQIGGVPQSSCPEFSDLSGNTPHKVGKEKGKESNGKLPIFGKD